MTNRERLLTAMGGSGGASNRDKLISAMNGWGNTPNRDKFIAAMNPTSVGRDDLGAPNNTTTSVGGDVLIAPKTSRQTTNTKPLTGFATGVQANNTGYMKMALKKAGLPADTYIAPAQAYQSEQPIKGFAAGVQANNEGYKALAEEKAANGKGYVNYLARKAVGGGMDFYEGAGNFFGYAQQGFAKGAEMQAANAMRSAAATTKSEAAKAALTPLAEVQQEAAVKNLKTPTETYLNFADNYIAKTEEMHADKDYGFVGQLGGDVAQGLGGEVAKLPFRVFKGVGEVALFISSFGNAMQSAKKEGKSDAEALPYAFATASVELITEKMLGFADFTGKGGFDDAIEEGIKEISSNPMVQKSLRTIAGGVGEGFEEFIAGVSDAYVNKLTIKTDKRTFGEILKDSGYDALVAGITGVVVSTANVISGGEGNTIDQEQFGEIVDAITTQAAAETNAEIEAMIAAGEALNSNGTRDTAINDDPQDHTAAEQAIIERYKSSADASLRTFIEKVRGIVNNDYKNKIRHELKTVTDRALVEAQKLTGTNTSNFKQIIKGNTVQHIDKRHGTDGEADRSMANIDDFSRLNFVLDNFTDARIIPITEADPETRKLSGEWNNTDGTPAPLVQFSMPINGTYYVVEAVPASKAKVMAVVSAYISPKTNKSTLNQELSLAENQPGNLTPKTVPEILRASTSNIPQVKTQVNGKADGETSPVHSANPKSENQIPMDKFLYTEALMRKAEREGNIYTQRLLQKEIEEAQRKIRKAKSEANGAMPTIYSDRIKSQEDELQQYIKDVEKELGKESFSTDARDKLGEIVARGTTKIKQGFTAFSKDDVLFERTKLVKPDGNKFDIAMHGTSQSVAFGGREVNMSPRLLAAIIKHNKDYNGQEIRLLSCNTGRKTDDDYCFAEELANALGVTVYAPNDLLIFNDDGTFEIGRYGEGKFVPYKPNERRRLK